MGRGRAKAKQTKVARELKYSSPATDFSQLQKELSGDPHSEESHTENPADDFEEDPYARWVDGDEA